MTQIIDFIIVFSNLFFEMAFYLMLGLFFVGFLHIFISKEMITKHIGNNSLWSVAKASLFGIPLPLCSCGVVPAAVFLSKNGASRGSVVSFLTSTPQTGVDSIIATYGMMGPIFAIFRPIAALIMGIASGILVHFVKPAADSIFAPENDNEINSSNINKTSSDTIIKKITNAAKYSFVEFLDDIAVRFLIGLFVAALITYFIPEDFFSNTSISSGILGMLLMIAIGVPMYICATASIPIAVSLLLKGFSPGVAFVFLAAGPAVNVASFSILLKSIGKQTAFAYLALLIILSIAFGLLLDLVFNLFELDPTKYLIDCRASCFEEMSLFNWFFGILFLLLILASLYRIYIRKYFIKPKSYENMTTIKVEGMNCNHCVQSVSNAISDISGIKNFKIDLPSETLHIEGEFDMSELKEKVETKGYKVTKI